MSSVGILVERRKRLKTSIQALERERASLKTQLEIAVLTVEQIQTIEQVAQRVQPGSQAAAKGYEARQRIVESLGLRVTVAPEGNEEKVAYVQRLIDGTRLPIVTGTSRRSRHNPEHRFAICHRIALTPTQCAVKPRYSGIGVFSATSIRGLEADCHSRVLVSLQRKVSDQRC